MIKAANREDVLTLALNGKASNLNRQLETATLVHLLDDKKVAILSILLYGHNMDDTSKPLHHRVEGLLPIKGQVEPMSVVFDVLDSDFKQLVDAKTLLESSK